MADVGFHLRKKVALLGAFIYVEVEMRIVVQLKGEAAKNFPLFFPINWLGSWNVDICYK